MVVVAKAAPDRCTEIGDVTGQADARSGGSWVTTDELIRYATADLRNQAGAKGATHVEVGPPRFLDENGRKVVAILVGKAYACGAGTSGGYVAPDAPTAPETVPGDEGLTSDVFASPSEPLVEGDETPTTPPDSTSVEASVRAWLEAAREDVLSCVASDRAALRVEISPEGTTSVVLHGSGAGSPEERCVAATLGAYSLSDSAKGSAYSVIHVLRRPSP